MFRCIVSHPGVWEDAKHAYMNELLIRKVGIPALVAILYHDLMRHLLMDGTVDFVVGMDMRRVHLVPNFVCHVLNRV